MAECITSQWASTAPQIKLVIDRIGNGPGASRYEWILYYVASSAPTTSSSRAFRVGYESASGESYSTGGSFDINGKTGTHVIDSGTVTISKQSSINTVTWTCSIDWNLTWSGVYKDTSTATTTIKVEAAQSYTIKYDSNDADTVISIPTQTYYHGDYVIIPTTVPTRTGYVFESWNTSADGSGTTYHPGDISTPEGNIILYAQWVANTHIISYDAKGGIGAPSNQTKTYGEDIKISDTKPTMEGYKFLGWGLSASSTTVSYSPGDTYSKNSSITLYAIWKLDVEKPTISYFKVYRCDSEGTPSDDGTYFAVSFTQKTSLDLLSIIVEWKKADATIWVYSINITSNTERITSVIGDGELLVDSAYEVRVTVSDISEESTSVSATIPSKAYTIDALAGGKGLAFGKPAETENLLDSNWALRIRDTLTVDKSIDVGGEIYDQYGQRITNGLSVYATEGIDPNTTLEHLILTDYDNTPMPGYFWYIETKFYGSKSESSNRMQTAYSYAKHEMAYCRHYYNGAWSKWRGISCCQQEYGVEKFTGNRWVDGKPIYRAVIPINVTTLKTNVTIDTYTDPSTGEEWALPFYDVDQVISITSAITRTASGSIFPHTYFRLTTDYHNIWLTPVVVYDDYTNLNIVVYTTHALSGHIIVEYTAKYTVGANRPYESSFYDNL